MNIGTYIMNIYVYWGDPCKHGCCCGVAALLDPHSGRCQERTESFHRDVKEGSSLGTNTCWLCHSQSPAWCHTTSSNMTDHEQTRSKLTQLNTSHLDTAGRTEQRRCAGCHQSWCHLSKHTAKSLHWSQAEQTKPAAHPADTRGVTTCQGEGRTFPSTSSPWDLKEVSLSMTHPCPAGWFPGKHKARVMGKLTLKHQEKITNCECSVRGKKVSKAGRLGRSWCNRDEVLLLTSWSGSLAVAASETFYMGS